MKILSEWRDWWAWKKSWNKIIACINAYQIEIFNQISPQREIFVDEQD